jgi:hypothetical protein
MNDPMMEEEVEEAAAIVNGQMEEEEEEVEVGTVFHISLKQSPSTLLHKMNLPESIRRNFRYTYFLFPSFYFQYNLATIFFQCCHFQCLVSFSAVAWCAKLNAIACATETCARIPMFVFLFIFSLLVFS